MIPCKACDQAIKEEKRNKLLSDATNWAKKEGLTTAVILEGPNGHRFYCACDDPRAARLTRIEYVQVVP